MYSENGSRGYKEAIVALNSLQSNASVLASIQAAGPQPGERVFGQTTYYLRRLATRDLNVLNAIHISGTKGKGSTAAFCSTLLSTINPSAKVGLFTSPHLVAVRERIRINGKPISEEVFARYFWELWERFEDGHGEPVRADLPIRPAYFRYLTYMSYHAFIAERVDATIFEVGVGGLLDPTNLIPSPIVTGVSSLGIDHVHVLGLAGNTSKKCCFAIALVTHFSDPTTTINKLLQPCISDSGHYRSATPSDRLPPLPLESFTPGYQTAQIINYPASLDLVQPKLSDVLKAGIANTRWPGRCQTIVDPVREGVTWYSRCDHSSSDQRRKILIFNCTFGRNARNLLESLVKPLSQKSAQPVGWILRPGDHYQAHISSSSTSSGLSKRQPLDLRSVATDTQSDPDHSIQQEIARHGSRSQNRQGTFMVTGSIEKLSKVVKQQIAGSTSVLVTKLTSHRWTMDVAGLKYFSSSLFEISDCNPWCHIHHNLPRSRLHSRLEHSRTPNIPSY
ncbi:hypothetical protein H4Q26_017188 [Puccinia striiformis f. sp. tritici PST-130]|nr:hypothetical protein H4Q26_017188 [Puccinia striiformis f. sp. tritici PST-130]